MRTATFFILVGAAYLASCSRSDDTNFRTAGSKTVASGEEKAAIESKTADVKVLEGAKIKQIPETDIKIIPNEPVLTDTAPAKDAISKVTPTKLNSAFRNPGKGWVVYDFTPDKNSWIDNTKVASLVYSNFFSWGDLEPSEGQYDFSPIDNLISKTYVGQTIGIAIVSIDPTSRPTGGARHKGQVPYWLQNKMGASGGTCLPVAGGFTVKLWEGDTHQCVFAPNYYNWYFLDAHKKLIKALASRYASSWRGLLSMVEISTYGYWGEWHQEDYAWPSDALQKQTLKQMIDDYLDAFAPYPEVKLEISGAVDRINPSSAAGPTYDLSGVYYAMSKGVRVVRKFIGADESVYVKPYEAYLLGAMPTYSPLRLEWGSWDGYIFDFYDPVNSLYRNYLHNAVPRALEFRSSYLGWYKSTEQLYCNSGPTDYNNCSYCAPGATTDTCKNRGFEGREPRQYSPLGMTASTGETFFDYAQKYLGYRFEVSKIEHNQRVAKGELLPVAFTMNQVGVAKLYDSYQIKFWAVRPGEEVEIGAAPFTANQWPTGVNSNKVISVDTLRVPTNSKSGWWKLKYAIVDSFGQPAMNLAITGKDVNDLNIYGRYTAGDLYID